jgi:hypothetical protein
MPRHDVNASQKKTNAKKNKCNANRRTKNNANHAKKQWQDPTEGLNHTDSI